MSALRTAADRLRGTLDREREGGAGADFTAAKLAGLSALNDALGPGEPDPEEREALRALADAATRNRATLEARRDAARALVADLGQRLIEADADGIYTRGEVLGINGPVPRPDRAR